MTDITTGLEKAEGEILAFEVSDEALEIAAWARRRRRRTSPSGLCTGLSECPMADPLNCT